MTTEVLMPGSPRWDEFCSALSDKLTISVDPFQWRCDGDAGPNVHRHAKQVMDSMGNVDVEGSIEYFEHHGGYCDCEVLFNVMDD